MKKTFCDPFRNPTSDAIDDAYTAGLVDGYDEAKADIFDLLQILDPQDWTDDDSVKSSITYKLKNLLAKLEEVKERG